MSLCRVEVWRLLAVQPLPRASGMACLCRPAALRRQDRSAACRVEKRVLRGLRYGATMLMIAVVPLILTTCANPWPENPTSPLARLIKYDIGQSSSRFHGNYCGYGRTNGDFSSTPVDALDEACRRHDICYATTSDHCKCNSQLRAAAKAIAADKSLPMSIREKGRAIQTSVSIGICKAFPNGVLPRI
jgi:hypothetical protein